MELQSAAPQPGAIPARTEFVLFRSSEAMHDREWLRCICVPPMSKRSGRCAGRGFATTAEMQRASAKTIS